MQARYQSGEWGRFLSEDQVFLAVGDRKFNQKFESSQRYDKQSDPESKQALKEYLSDPQNLNSYSYAKNNPIKYTDPDGEQAQTLGLTLQTAGGSLAAFSLLLDSTIFGLPAGVVIGGVGVVAIGTGATIAYLARERQPMPVDPGKNQIPSSATLKTPDETSLFPNGLPPGTPGWKKAGLVGVGTAVVVKGFVDAYKAVKDSIKDSFNKADNQVNLTPANNQSQGTVIQQANPKDKNKTN